MIGIAVYVGALLGQASVQPLDSPQRMAYQPPPSSSATATGSTARIPSAPPANAPAFVFEEKRLKVRNATHEPVIVWVQVYGKGGADPAAPAASAASGSGAASAGKGWRWEPGPDRPLALAYLIDPGGQPALIGLGGDKTQAVRGVKAHVWAESESGMRWDAHRRDDLWLVSVDSGSGKREYKAQDIEDFVHTLEPPAAMRRFAERLIGFRNETNEPLTVTLEYRSERQGEARWRKFPSEIVVPPGEDVWPRGEHNWRIRASRIRVSALGQTRKYEIKAPNSVWAVENSGSGRSYLASRIGTYLHVFKKPTIDVPAPTPTNP